MRFPARPPNIDPRALAPDLFATLLKNSSPVLPDGRYLHWNELRFRPPPEGLKAEQWWLAQKFARSSARAPIRGFSEDGLDFWYCRLDAIDRATHELDRKDAARELIDAMGDEGVRRRYRIDQLIEEAINSSLIEGAKLTTRAQAKEMVRDGKEPTSRGERMVLNNYAAMRRLLEIAPQRTLTLDDLLEIHAILGEDALDSEGCAGRLRTANDNLRVEDAITGDVWFQPPPAESLRERLALLLDFANQASDTQFVHPLIRAITLHFWLAYLHPFVDGNGRMARALFYWQMLRAGYDFAQYLSISGPIDRSRRTYYLAFAYVETDGGDLTYFVLHQLKVLRSATDDLVNHLKSRSERLRYLETAVADIAELNERQQSVLAYLARNPHQSVTISRHAKSHDVVYLTARRDLQDLEGKELLRRVRQGRTDRYYPTDGFLNRSGNPTGTQNPKLGPPIR